MYVYVASNALGSFNARSGSMSDFSSTPFPAWYADIDPVVAVSKMATFHFVNDSTPHELARLPSKTGPKGGGRGEGGGRGGGGEGAQPVTNPISAMHWHSHAPSTP
jgi:hypothetical protein